MDAESRKRLQEWLISQPTFLRELIAGGLAGGIGKTAVAPLERTKILFQTGGVDMQQGVPATLMLMFKNEGVAGLFKGNGASVLRIVPYAAIHFGSYEWYRRLLVDHIIPDPYVHPKARHPEHLPNKGADQGSVGASHDKGDTASVPISAQTDALHIAHDKLTPHVSTASTNTDALHTAHDELIHHVSLASMGESSSVTNVLPAAPQASQMYGGSQSVPHLSSRDEAAARRSSNPGKNSRSPISSSNSNSSSANSSSSDSSSSTNGCSSNGNSSTNGCSSDSSNSNCSNTNSRSSDSNRGSTSVSSSGSSIMNISGSNIDSGSSNGTSSSSDGSTTSIGNTAPPPQRRQRGKHEHINPVWDLVAGSCAGATAVVITYPLDLIRARLAWASAGISEGHSAASASALAHQGSTPAAGAASGAGVGVARGGGGGVASSAGSGAVRPTSQATIRSVVSEVVQIEGAAGLYRGMAPTLLGILPYAGIKFYVYQSLKTRYRDSSWGIADEAKNPSVSPRLPIHVMLACGAFSGIVAQTLTYPLDVVRRRMQVRSLGGSGETDAVKPSSLNTVKSIVAKNGLRGLFRGLSINYMKVVPSTAIGFTVYDQLKIFLAVKGNL